VRSIAVDLLLDDAAEERPAEIDLGDLEIGVERPDRPGIGGQEREVAGDGTAGGFLSPQDPLDPRAADAAHRNRRNVDRRQVDAALPYPVAADRDLPPLVGADLRDQGARSSMDELLCLPFLGDRRRLAHGRLLRTVSLKMRTIFASNAKFMIL
jgi:hypothetical protein